MKKYAITIDSCALSLLISKNLDIYKALPPFDFKIFSPHHVFVEIEAIKDPEKREKHLEIMKISKIERTGTFGFAINGGEGNQPYLGFDMGTFAGDEEIEWRASNKIEPGPMKKSGWHGDETDLELAYATENSIVVTAENKETRGPLKQKARQDRVVRLSINQSYTEEIILQMVRDAIDASGLEPVQFYE